MTPMVRKEKDFPQSLNMTLAKMKAINALPNVEQIR